MGTLHYARHLPEVLVFRKRADGLPRISSSEAGCATFDPGPAVVDTRAYSTCWSNYTAGPFVILGGSVWRAKDVLVIAESATSGS